MAAKWHLRDEQDAGRAWELLQALLNGVFALIAMASLRTPARLSFAQAQTAIADFLDLNLPTVDDAALLVAAFPLIY